MPKSQKHPVTAPQAVTTQRLSDEIGLLRVAMFPGAIAVHRENVVKYRDKPFPTNPQGIADLS